MNRIIYPPARRDSTCEDYHGTEVHDPYRWLEDEDSEESRTWTDMESRLTGEYLDRNPDRPAIRERLLSLWDYPKYSVPECAGSRYFYFRNGGLQNQPVLYMQESLEGESLAILDPNDLSDDGTVSVNMADFNKEGTLMAYSVSRSGSDWHEIRIRHIDSHKDYEEVIQWSRGGGVAWKHDSSGFYYSRFPEPGSVAPEDSSKYNRLYFHRLGTPTSQDRLVYERPDFKELTFFPTVSDDGDYLIITSFWESGPKNRLYYSRIDDDQHIIRLIDEDDGHYRFIDNRGPLFYIETDLDAPKGRIVALDTRTPAREAWEEIVPEQHDTLSSVTSVHDCLACALMHDAHDVLKLYRLDGSFLGDIALPEAGSLGALSAKSSGSELFFSFTSFLSPARIFRYDFEKESLTLFRDSELRFDTSSFETEQVFFTSKDGTEIPMFITRRKGMIPDGANPVILYGYGGFSLSMTPFFSLANLLWLEHGGVYAVVNLRGGGEYGEEWHKAGMKDKKQNVFDDFIGAAEWLIDRGYTKPSRLAINGGSNGGLLVAACLIQRPELFGAVICEVPLTDMLRYHKFTVGHYWIGEYGDPDRSRADFEAIHAYSPLHNVREGTVFPHVFVRTADHDDRVVAGHAKKFVAALQYADAGENPILLYLQTKAGHGMGKPTTKAIDEKSDILSYLFGLFGISFRR